MLVFVLQCVHLDKTGHFPVTFPSLHSCASVTTPAPKPRSLCHRSVTAGSLRPARRSPKTTALRRHAVLIAPSCSPAQEIPAWLSDPSWAAAWLPVCLPITPSDCLSLQQCDCLLGCPDIRSPVRPSTSCLLTSLIQPHSALLLKEQ